MDSYLWWGSQSLEVVATVFSDIISGNTSRAKNLYSVKDSKLQSEKWLFSIGGYYECRMTKKLLERRESNFHPVIHFSWLILWADCSKQISVKNYWRTNYRYILLKVYTYIEGNRFFLCTHKNNVFKHVPKLCKHNSHQMYSTFTARRPQES